MGNQNCCCREKKEFKIKYKKIDISKKFLMELSKTDLKYRIETLKSERFDNIFFTIVYGIASVGGIILISFVPEPTLGISTFLMCSSLSYYIKNTIKNKYDIYDFIKELERREKLFKKSKN